MRIQTRLLAAATAALLCTAPAAAFASWLQPHTRQEAIPQADVERPLITGKSWLVAEFDFSWKRSTSHFLGSETANVGLTEGTHWEAEDNEGRWDYRRFQLNLAWGFSKNVDFVASIPLVWASVWNNRMVDADGAENPITSWGLGDVHAGIRFQPLRMQSEDGRISNSLIVGLDMRMPSGAESPGSYIGGPNNVVTIVTGGGTWGWDFFARYKQHLYILGIEAGLGYTLSPTNTVMYLVETENNQFNQSFDPGDVIHGDVKLTIQPIKYIAVQGSLDISYRLASRWGSTVDTVPYCKDCPEVPGSEGLYMDVGARLISDPTLRLGIDVYFNYTVAGRRNWLWPIEEISPSRGWTLGGNLSYRF